MNNETLTRLTGHRILMAIDQTLIVPKHMYDILRAVPEAQATELLTDLFMLSPDEVASQGFADVMAVAADNGDRFVKELTAWIIEKTAVKTKPYFSVRRPTEAIVWDAITRAAKSLPGLKPAKPAAVLDYMRNKGNSLEDVGRLEAIDRESPGAVRAEWVYAYEDLGPVGARAYGFEAAPDFNDPTIKLILIDERHRGFGYEELAVEEKIY